MPKKFCVSLVIELPEDPWQAAELQLQLSKPWLTMCQHLNEAGIKYQENIDKMETKAKQQRGPRQQKPTPTLVPPADAA